MADSNNSGGRRPTYPAGTIAKVATEILNETFQNIIHDLVAKVHREEKVARMRSAVVLARQKAEEDAIMPEEAPSKTSTDTKREIVLDTKKLAGMRMETDAAVFNRGKVFLKGNPMKTLKEHVCPDCRLPKLMYPTTGSHSCPPPDPDAEYCTNMPMIDLPGHDVHGKLFAVMPNPKKKKGDRDSTIPEIPTTKCPICPRYFVMTRLAQHLERCVYGGRGGGGRNQTPTDNGVSNGNSPSSSAPKRPYADDDEESPSPTKKKKLNGPKKGSTTKPGPSKLKQSFTVEDNDDDIKSENAD
ncbi:SAGA complex, Sgf11 subunit [Penicillium italicum]|uniref:SAGA-associated factor 11 n=1 Tax=Penicillium italicum TaxID=40296 RepID=A0A0A2KJX5_PENIT|nr:SAGA complex, Sgf11 subunit [Penicillium italicum]